jgi:EmrB/QacA subfamily drug resistance transporter
VAPPTGTTEVTMAPTPNHRGWALALTAIGFFMVTLDNLVVVTALPDIGRSLHAGLGGLEWTVNAYTLGAAVIITAAALGDRLGRRRVFIAGLVLFTVASAACALAPTAGALIAARAVQGVGGAIVLPLSLTILTTSFPPERRGTVIGVWGGVAGIAVAGGPLIGGAVTQGLDWHWIFWINVPVGIAAAIGSRLRLAETRGPATRLDIPALVLIAAATTALMWALVHAAEAGWSAAGTRLALLGGVIALLALIGWERRAQAPMLPPRLFANRGFTAGVAAGLLMTAALLGAVFLTSQYLQVALGYGPLATGVRLLPWTATPLLIAPAAGALADRIGGRRVLATGLALQALGLAVFGYDATVAPSYPRLCLPLLVAGIGVSMALPTAATVAVGSVPPAEIGTASGVSNTLQRFGGALGIAVLAAVFAGHGHLGTTATFVAGFRPAIGTAALISAVGAAAALAIPRRRPTAVAVPDLAVPAVNRA